MKKSLVSAILIAALLTACAQSQVHFADPVDVEKALAESEALAAEVAAEKIETTTAEPKPTQVQTEEPEPTPEPTSVPTPAVEREAEPTVEPEQNPATVPQSDSAPDPTPAPTPEPAPAPAYGAVPFELAAGTDKWWKIDATDSAYWAMQEQINAVRAAGGLPALAMDDGLSAIASTRCESFVAGGPFDHSGMTTTSEILAAGKCCLRRVGSQRCPLCQHHAHRHFQYGRWLLVLRYRSGAVHLLDSNIPVKQKTHYFSAPVPTGWALFY